MHSTVNEARCLYDDSFKLRRAYVPRLKLERKRPAAAIPQRG
jgi:hypothetical protein